MLRTQLYNYMFQIDIDFEQLHEGKGNRLYDEWDKWQSIILEKAHGKATRNKEKKTFLKDFKLKKGGDYFISAFQVYQIIISLLFSYRISVVPRLVFESTLVFTSFTAFKSKGNWTPAFKENSYFY